MGASGQEGTGGAAGPALTLKDGATGPGTPAAPGSQRRQSVAWRPRAHGPVDAFVRGPRGGASARLRVSSRTSVRTVQGPQDTRAGRTARGGTDTRGGCGKARLGVTRTVCRRLPPDRSAGRRSEVARMSLNLNDTPRSASRPRSHRRGARRRFPDLSRQTSRHDGQHAELAQLPQCPQPYTKPTRGALARTAAAGTLPELGRPPRAPPDARATTRARPRADDTSRAPPPGEELAPMPCPVPTVVTLETKTCDSPDPRT